MSNLKPSSFRRTDWTGLLYGAILAGGAIAAYSRTFSVPFLFDDAPAISENPSIRHLWPIWHALSPPSAVGNTVGGRPVLNLSLAVNYAISGTGVGGYHALNLTIHILAGLILFGILRRTLERCGLVGQAVGLAPGQRPGLQTAPTIVAFAAALLWTLHPLQTESVTYIVQRAESLMGLFYLLTLYCFILGVEANDRGGARCPQRAGPAGDVAQRVGDNALHLGSIWFALSVAACFLGMGTKEVMVSAPVIVFLYDRTFFAGSFQEAWRRRWGVYAGLGATWLILPFLVRSTHGRGGTSGFGNGVSWWHYAQTQFPAIVDYLKLSLWPHPLDFDYGTQWVANGWTVVPAAVIVIGLAVVAAWALLRSPGVGQADGLAPGHRPGLQGQALGFAGAWFFAILAPTSLIPGNRQTSAEHRMYLALIPVVVLVVVGIYRWLGRAALPVCMILGAALALLTFRRNEDYRSALTLWSDTVAKSPWNAFAHNSLGYILEKMPGRSKDAIVEYGEAVRLEPGFVEAHDNLGVLLNAAGRTREAIAQFVEALRLKPGDPPAHNNLGNALRAEGRALEATAQYEEALRLRPDYAEAHYNLGNVLNDRGRTLDAISHYEEAVRLKPDYADAHNNLAILLARSGRFPEAAEQCAQALRIDPGLKSAHRNYGNILMRLGRVSEARAQYDEASRK